MTNLEIFRKDFLEANTWLQLKDGFPLYLLDNLNANELKIAEQELINILNVRDTRSIEGLGHIKSKAALPGLYKIVAETTGAFKVKVAHSIFKINGDHKMIDVAFHEINQISDHYELINILHLIPDFKDRGMMEMLHSFRNHNKYLVAYKATNVLGISTDEVVKKFSNKNNR